MLKLLKLTASSFLVISIVLIPRTTHAQQQSSASPNTSVTTLVTVLGPSFTAPPALGKSDVVVHTGKHREDVTGWSLAQGDNATLQLAILIDDGATDFGTHLDEVRHFIQAQPKSANIGVFYASNGMTLAVAPFSTDHDAVASKVRITLGPTSTSTSIYLSLIDVLKKLQSLPGRREVLVIADGHDRLRGDLPESPDLDNAMASAQRVGIVVHTLYAHVGRSRRGFSLTLAQGNLNHIASATGGQAFFQGLDTPVSFTPFLNQLDMVLHNQYFLTFATDRSTRRKGELRSFKVDTEQHNISITAPSEVFVLGPAR